jgi:hypothetical protein
VLTVSVGKAGSSRGCFLPSLDVLCTLVVLTFIGVEGEGAVAWKIGGLPRLGLEDGRVVISRFASRSERKRRLSMVCSEQFLTEERIVLS